MTAVVVNHYAEGGALARVSSPMSWTACDLHLPTGTVLRGTPIRGRGSMMFFEFYHHHNRERCGGKDHAFCLPNYGFTLVSPLECLAIGAFDAAADDLTTEGAEGIENSDEQATIGH